MLYYLGYLTLLAALFFVAHGVVYLLQSILAVASVYSKNGTITGVTSKAIYVRAFRTAVVALLAIVLFQLTFWLWS